MDRVKFQFSHISGLTKKTLSPFDEGGEADYFAYTEYPPKCSYLFDPVELGDNLSLYLQGEFQTENSCLYIIEKWFLCQHQRHYQLDDVVQKLPQLVFSGEWNDFCVFVDPSKHQEKSCIVSHHIDLIKTIREALSYCHSNEVDCVAGRVVEVVNP